MKKYKKLKNRYSPFYCSLGTKKTNILVNHTRKILTFNNISHKIKEKFIKKIHK